MLKELHAHVCFNVFTSNYNMDLRGHVYRLCMYMYKRCAHACTCKMLYVHVPETGACAMLPSYIELTNHVTND